MLGIVIIGHGQLASEFRQAVEHIMGPQRFLEAIDIAPEDDIEKRRQELLQAVTGLDQGNGVVVLSDMFGGTPSNLALSLLNQKNVEVIAGVNLPMLIKLIDDRRHCALPEAALKAQEAARKYITIASRFLRAAND